MNEQLIKELIAEVNHSGDISDGSKEIIVEILSQAAERRK